MNPTPALRVTGLSKRFRQVSAINQVYLDVPQGSIVSLIGPSGCGKSTLLRCMTWLEPPDEGFVEINGTPFGRQLEGEIIRHQSRRQIDRLRPRLGLVFQQFNLWPHLTLRDNIVKAQRVVLGRGRDEAHGRAERLMAQFALTAVADRHPWQLSGGQKQRAAIARALAMDPEVMLFDEPTSALDPELVGEVQTLLRSLAQNGMTMLIVTHDIRFAVNVSGRIAFMCDGSIIEEGPVDRVVASPRDARLQQFLALTFASGHVNPATKE
ncbi:amino acid ABC transporter ATP-binding protein [Sodalis sp. RH21]|uniref:amino acid ABC transporter ATP-binding protein n=1 Tax=unclassified Sodalis (in: enterobacteria) TaxID=2636512 RepID=UPI0039B49206